MRDEINWTLDEITLLYQLHPERCEVFVEGDEDRGLTEWFLEQEGYSGVVVYSIDVVSIPSGLVIGHGLAHPSRRSEVIALALELDRECPEAKRVTCIADADFARVEKEEIICPVLLMTDYTSIEMYAFKPAILDRLLNVVQPRLMLRGEDILQSISPMLQTLFALRLATKELKWDLAWLSFDRCTKLNNGRIEFDRDEYIGRYLNTRGRRGDEAIFRSKLADVMERFSQEVRNQIRGHDFIEVLSWFLTKRAKIVEAKPGHVSHLLMIQLTPEELREEGLFKALRERYQNVAEATGEPN
jgi:hypothetical protein